MGFLIPGVAATTGSEQPDPQQAAAMLHNYSPRLFGSPPQLTNLNDMRLMSAAGGTEGPVGDFYLNNVLRDAMVANFVVGRARFTGGMSSVANAIRVAMQYAHAMSKYGDSSTGAAWQTSASAAVTESELLKAYNAATSNDIQDASTSYTSVSASSIVGLIMSELGEDANVSSEMSTISGQISSSVGSWFGGKLFAPVLTSLAVQQPFYTFESDWHTYINNVKMMINAAVVMLGLQDATVRIGNTMFGIAPTTKVDAASDVWANYRYITPTSGLGTVQELDSQNGDTSQYVSFMIDPKGISESYQNSVGESKIYSSVLNMGNEYGNEIAFITSSTASSIDDKLLQLTDDVVSAAESVMSNLGSAGRFTASLASSMFRSFKGDHTIYPLIFQNHTSNSSELSMTVKLRASGGDPYSYLTEILVPMFFALAMVLPQMSKNSGASYSYPPIIQCNIPGIFGTRLGMVTSLSITKNPDGTDVSVYGYPTSVDMTINVTDLQHCMMTSPMDKMAVMLNNHTMFDYIAQCCAVDKYRMNGSMRLITKAILAASDGANLGYNVGSALKSDFYSWANKFLGTSRM